MFSANTLAYTSGDSACAMRRVFGSSSSTHNTRRNRCQKMRAVLPHLHPISSTVIPLYFASEYRRAKSRLYADEVVPASTMRSTLKYDSGMLDDVGPETESATTTGVTAAPAQSSARENALSRCGCA